MNEQGPLPWTVAGREVLRCAARTVVLIGRRRMHLPRERVGLRLRFADDTSSWVFRETVVDRAAPPEPCALVVEFRLRLVRGWGHALFRRESLLNTPLFVGFPGFVSKLWLAHDEHDVYRGIYDWDGPELAEHYARSLWRVLQLGCVPGSIHYRVLPGVRRDELVANPQLLSGSPHEEAAAWWRPAAA